MALFLSPGTMRVIELIEVDSTAIAGSVHVSCSAQADLLFPATLHVEESKA